MPKQLVQVVNKVNNAAIRRIRNERGDLVYVVPSYTLPDNCVMNGGLYPAEEIAAAYQALNDTPAPAGHPYDADGNYVSASSPDGVLYFQCGIFNKNVQRQADDTYGHRVYVEKHIHVETAMKTERGKRILDAIDKGEPIHSSTGVLVDVVNESGVAPNGNPYEWVARGLVFDHDAVLLDEEGAATPADGVGLLVNQHLIKAVQRNGQTMQVNSAALNTNQPDALGIVEQVKTMLESFFNRVANSGSNKETTEDDDMSLKTLMKERLGDAYNEDMTDEEMLNAFDKMKEKANEETEEPKGEAVANSDLQKLIADAVAAQFAANKSQEEQEERTALADKLKANGVELDAADVKAMSVNALKALVNKTAAKPAAYHIAGGQVQVNQDTSIKFDDLPE